MIHFNLESNNDSRLRTLVFGFAIVNAKVSDIIYHWIQAEGNSVLEILGQKLGSAELDGKL